jgi:putative flippase GtrA
MSDLDIVTSPETQQAASISALGSSTLHEFIRYFAASLVALVVDVCILWLLTSVVGVEYLISAGISFFFGLMIVYLASIWWIFDQHRMGSRVAEFLVFALVGLVGLMINEGILYVLTGMLGLYYLLSKVVSVFVVFTWNFFARKYLLFAKQ